MRTDAEGFSIVIIGAWNAAIFSPQWVAGHLTESQDIGLEVLLQNPSLPPRLRFEGIFLKILPDRLVLNSPEVNNDQLTLMQTVAVKVLTDLPHTPVQAVGVNFRFHESDPTGRLLGAFKLSDQGHLSDAGISVSSTSIKRRVSIAEHVLFLTLESGENDEVIVDFNFHRDVTNAEAAKQHLEDGIIQFQEQAENVLQTVYEIQDIEE